VEALESALGMVGKVLLTLAALRAVTGMPSALIGGRLEVLVNKLEQMLLVLFG
jgi:hypothetical protein